ncbi:MAG: hypothetical protein ACM3UY_06720 [Methanocella sp.]|jgi:hypothetical protein
MVGVQGKASVSPGVLGSSSVDVGGSLGSSSFHAGVDAGTLPNEPQLYHAVFEGLVYVRYLDHVAFNRSSALVMAPQTRKAVGWLVYECSEYVTLAFDRDAGPPTLKGGDAKASGLVLLKSAVLELKKLSISSLLEYYLNCKRGLVENRVCASSQRSEKLSPKNKRKGPK